MYNKELAIEILKQIDHSLYTIIRRFKSISNVSDFYDTEVGLEKLDSICMQLITIGESLKIFDKISGQSILSHYSQIDWKGAKGMRDIITHHYFDLDAEIVFNVCDEKVGPMKNCIELIIADITNNKI